MADQLLPTHVLIDAARQQATGAGAFFYIRHKGDTDRGTVLLKLNNLAGRHTLYRQIWDGTARRLEMIGEAEVDDSALEQAIAEETSFDRDVWVIEVEDREGRLFFDTIFHESAANRP